MQILVVFGGFDPFFEGDFGESSTETYNLGAKDTQWNSAGLYPLEIFYAAAISIDNTIVSTGMR